MKHFIALVSAALLSLGLMAQTILFESTIDSVMKRTREYKLTGVNVDKYAAFFYETGSFIPDNTNLSRNEKLEWGRSFSCGYTFKKDLAPMTSVVIGGGYFRRTQRLNSDYPNNAFERDSSWTRAKFSSNATNAQVRIRKYLLKHGTQASSYLELAFEGYYFFNSKYAGVKKLEQLKLKRIEIDPSGFNSIQYSSSLKISFSNLALGLRYFPNSLFSSGKYIDENYGQWNFFFAVELPGDNRKSK